MSFARNSHKTHIFFLSLTWRSFLWVLWARFYGFYEFPTNPCILTKWQMFIIIFGFQFLRCLGFKLDLLRAASLTPAVRLVVDNRKAAAAPLKYVESFYWKYIETYGNLAIGTRRSANSIYVDSLSKTAIFREFTNKWQLVFPFSKVCKLWKRRQIEKTLSRFSKDFSPFRLPGRANLAQDARQLNPMKTGVHRMSTDRFPI